MRIAAGELDRRVEIWRAAMEDDGTATVLGEPALLGKRWARRLDVSDRERMRAAEMGQELGTRWLMRSDSVTRSITAKDQLRHGGAIFEITGTKQTPERGDGIELNTVARPDLGSGA